MKDIQDHYQKPDLLPMRLKNLKLDNCLILDTETTGLHQNDEVIELALLDVEGNEVYHSLFHPQKRMGKEILQITGLNNAYLKDMPYFKDEWKKIYTFMRGKKIVAHNLHFDKRLIESTIQRYSLNLLEVHYAFESIVDTKQLFMKYLNLESYTLQDIMKFFHIEAKQKHRATYDCLDLLYCLRELEYYLIQHSKESLSDTQKQLALLSYQYGLSLDTISRLYSINKKRMIDVFVENKIPLHFDTNRLHQIELLLLANQLDQHIEFNEDEIYYVTHYLKS